MAKTIPELKRELEDAKLKHQYYEGKQEAIRLKREIFRLKHPNYQKAKGRLKATGKEIGKGLTYMGKKSFEAIKSENKVPRKILPKSHRLIRTPSRTSIGKRKKHSRYKRYPRSRRKVRRRYNSYSNSFNPSNPFGLSF